MKSLRSILSPPSAEAAPPPPPLAPARDALFLDLDGTLAPIMPRPEDVIAEPALTALLCEVDRRLGGRIAVVSGRTIADVDRILQGACSTVAGVHGLERRTATGQWRAEPAPGLVPALAELDAWAAQRVGLDIENKTLGLTVHYRRAPAQEADARAFVAALAKRHGLAFQPGHMIAELKTPGADKGVAVRALMAGPPFADARPIFVGDDLTDEHGFAAAAALGGWGVRVGAARDTAAVYALDDPAAVRAWLGAAT